MAGISGTSTDPSIAGVTGENTAATPGGVGVAGISTANDGVRANSTSGNGLSARSVSGVGVFAETQSMTYPAVYATATGQPGVVGISQSSDGVQATSTNGNGLSARSVSGVGVFAETQSMTYPAVSATATSQPGVVGTSQSSDGVRANSTSGNGLSARSVSGVGVFAETQSTTYPAVYAGATGQSGVAGQFDGNVTVAGTINATSGDYAVVGNATSSGGAGMIGYSRQTTGVAGHSTSGVGVFGYVEPVPGTLPPGGRQVPDAGPENPIYLGVAGVMGETIGPNQWGVLGLSEGSGGIGVAGVATGGNGASGVNGYCHGTTGGNGVSGICDTGNGVYGETNDPSQNYAGYFKGNVKVTGTLLKAAGGFLIDHPLDPESRQLCHSFVESSEMMNVYAGNAVLDAQGGAHIHLPTWFEALNVDFRYQLTCIGMFAAVYVAEEIANGRFKIAGGTQGMKVSWQVTGTRNDSYARDHRLPVEIDKPPKDVANRAAVASSADLKAA